MTLTFPRLVYRGPAVYELVHDEAEYEIAMRAGWNHCASEAVATANPAAGMSESQSDSKPLEATAPIDLPVTRDELLTQAERLKIDVDKRWGDKRLLAEIDKAMKG